MRNLARLILLFFLSSIFSLLFSLTPVFAQSPSPTNIISPNTSPNTNPDVPKNLHTYTQNVMIEVMSALTCQLAGIDPTNPNQQCLGVDQKTGKIGFVDPSTSSGRGGAIGVMSHMIGMLYTIPIHTGDYTHYLAQNFGIAKKTYAQGTGFEGLKPLLDVWTAFRNIVYLIFTIVFVVIGLAIMFRIKIDPRTVMTIQNQIPKIIVGIVLVTFSYAIAGFLIDIMYGSIYLIGNVMTSSGKTSPNLVTQMAQQTNPFQAAALLEHQPPGVATPLLGLPQIAWKPAETVGNFIQPFFDNPPGKVITGVIGFVIGTQVRRLAIESAQGLARIPRVLLEVFRVVGKTSPLPLPVGPILTNTLDVVIGGITGATLGFFLDDIAGFFVSVIAFLVIVIALLWSLFRLWFVLIMAYIYILIGVVLAPFWIAGGLIPGIPITFTGWLRWMMARIAVFPTTIGLFLLGKVFIDAFGTGETPNEFVPPLIANPASTEALGAIIGLGIILLSSNVANMTQRMFNAPKIDLGRIGQAIGVAPSMVSGTIGTVTQGLMLRQYTSGIKLWPFGRKEPQPGGNVPPPMSGAQR